MNRVFKYGLALLISYMPFNKLRCGLYNLFPGYSIKQTKLGIGTIIAGSEVNIEGVYIGRFNTFSGPMSIQIKSGVSIGKQNIFTCGEWVLSPEFQDKNYERSLLLEEGSLITDAHFFDVAGKFVLGKRSWIAGRASQFWTHGAGVIDRNITIGESCYIGSAVRVAPGCQIANAVLVGMGSVVTGKIEQSHVMIAGVPAKVVKENYDWQSKQPIQDS